MNRDTLKKIRWFSNGVWQFQPHLYFLVNLGPTQEQLSSLANGDVITVQSFKFKLEMEHA